MISRCWFTKPCLWNLLWLTVLNLFPISSPGFLACNLAFSAPSSAPVCCNNCGAWHCVQHKALAPLPLNPDCLGCSRRVNNRINHLNLAPRQRAITVFLRIWFLLIRTGISHCCCHFELKNISQKFNRIQLKSEEQNSLVLDRAHPARVSCALWCNFLCLQKSLFATKCIPCPDPVILSHKSYPRAFFTPKRLQLVGYIPNIPSIPATASN